MSRYRPLIAASVAPSHASHLTHSGKNHSKESTIKYSNNIHSPDIPADRGSDLRSEHPSEAIYNAQSRVQSTVVGYWATGRAEQS